MGETRKTTEIIKRNEKTLTHIKNLFYILLGNSLFALAIVMFIMPNNLITGGTTGIGLFLEKFGIPLTLFVSVFNSLIFLLGLFFLGKKFALTTLVSTFYYPFILGVFQEIPSLSNVTQEPLLSVIFAGVLIGAGIGIVIRAGASTGGMDIPPLILNRKFGIPVSTSLWVFDSLILVLQMIDSDKERILYGILLVVIYTTVIDKVLLFGKAQIQVKIISKMYQEINDAIHSKIDRGSTLMYAQTGFEKKDNPIVLSVVTGRELARLKEVVLEIDPNAFMIVNHVTEVKGKGFSLPKNL